MGCLCRARGWRFQLRIFHDPLIFFPSRVAPIRKKSSSSFFFPAALRMQVGIFKRTLEKFPLLFESCPVDAQRPRKSKFSSHAPFRSQGRGVSAADYVSLRAAAAPALQLR